MWAIITNDDTIMHAPCRCRDYEMRGSEANETTINRRPLSFSPSWHDLCHFFIFFYFRFFFFHTGTIRVGAHP
jgi:hypothetical protein